MHIFSRRRGVTAVSALGMTATLLLAGCGVGEDSDRTVLKVASGFTANHPLSVGGIGTLESDLTGKEDSLFDIEYWPGGQMGSVGDMVSLTRSGALDMSIVIPPYQADLVPLSTVGDLPGIDVDSCVASRAMTDLVRPGGALYESEFEPLGLMPLWSTAVTGYELWTNKEIRRPEDLRGLAVRSGGGAMDTIVRSMGASPVSLPSSEIFESLQRHIIDGTTFPPTTATEYSLDDVVKYRTVGSKIGNGPVMYVMQKETWDELSEEQQSELRKASDHALDETCQRLIDSEKKADKAMIEGGVEYVELNEEEQAAFDEYIAPVRKNWARDLDNRGKPGTEVLEAFDAAVARHAEGVPQ